MHSNGIPWESLPKSFQDAIAVCRVLDVSYLWIDSLCIIQDSTSDWHAQAREMESIYRGAYLTIAATGARDSTRGLFVDTEDRRIQGTWGTLFSRKLIKHHLDEIDSTLFPLLTRGWVYQERLLSPRVLHFGPHELFWECDRSISCECGESTSSILKPPKIVHRSILGKGTLSQEITVRWREIICEFTGMQLTDPTDRLAAIHGVAKQIGSARGDQYLFGLWEDSFTADILWYCDSPSSVQTKRIAPSWSWAAVSVPVSYHSVLVEKRFMHLL